MGMIQKNATTQWRNGNNPYFCRMEKEANHKNEYPLVPYTMEEIYAMIKEGEKQFAQGKWQDSEEMFHELEEEFRKEDQELLVVDPA